MTYTIPSYTVQPGSVYQPKTSGPAYILDQIGGVVGCWSTRRLLSTASGNIIRGRDATTNEEDFAAAAYPAGVVTLANGGDAFCPQLYDQSGNANHAAQPVAASQPKLVDTGSLIVDASGKPVVEFNGSSSAIVAPDAASLSPTTALTVSVWAKNSASTLSADEYLINKYDFLGDNREYSLSIDSASNQVQISLGNSVGLFAASWISSAGVNIENWNLYTFVFSPSSLSVYLNGSEIAGSVTGTLPTALGERSSNLAIGCRITNGSALVDFWGGGLNDAIIFNKSLTSVEVLNLYSALA